MLRVLDLGFVFRAKCCGLGSNFMVLTDYVCYCLSSSKGAVSGICRGLLQGFIKGDARSLGYSSCIAEVANLFI